LGKGNALVRNHNENGGSRRGEEKEARSRRGLMVHLNGEPGGNVKRESGGGEGEREPSQRASGSYLAEPLM